MKRTVGFGYLGSTLDRCSRGNRWEQWRPTVCLFQQEDLLIDRFELWYDEASRPLLEEVVADIRVVSPETEVRAHSLSFRDPWDFGRVYGALFDFVNDYPFDLDQEEYLVHITTGTHVLQICLFLLAESRHLPGRLIQTAPPKRPRLPGKYALIDLDLSQYDQIAERFALEQRESTAFLKSGIHTRNAAFNRVIDELEKVAVRSPAPILLMGPTGAGKSHLARRIYDLKKLRRQVQGPFVEINCGTLRGDGAMSALFGHRKGSFTGAVSDRPGLLRSADQGVLFLDEIGELGLDEQTMLLRAIEEKRFLPLGADEEVESQFQLISRTNRDLRKEVANGRFRADLFARINLWAFTLPGLKERREDIEPNLEYELDRYRQEHGRLARFNAEARRAFLDFARHPDSCWSGNFRDLNASVQRMATLAGGKRISIEIVRGEIERLRLLWQTDRSPDAADRDLLGTILDADTMAGLDLFEIPRLAAALRVCRECRSLSEAGRRLFQVSRQQKKTSNDADRMRKYLARFGLTWETVAPRPATMSDASR